MPNASFRAGSSSQIAQGDYRVRTVTASYSIDEDDDVVLVSTTSANVTVTLPLASTHRFKRFEVKRTTGGANTATVSTTGSALIDGAATVSLVTQYESISVVSDGTNWHLV